MENLLLLAQAIKTLEGAAELGLCINASLDFNKTPYVHMSLGQFKRAFKDYELVHRGSYADGSPILHYETTFMDVLFICLVDESQLTDAELASVGLERF